MGVSSTARLPSLGAQSIPPLFSHLQHTSNAKVVARWSITIRSFRAVPVPTNAWPPSNQYDSAFNSIPSDEASANIGSDAGSASGSSNQAGSLGNAASSSGRAGPSASGAPPLTKPRTMWQVWLSDHPGVVFVIVEDTGRSSRAKVWRDWEVSTKKWEKQKRREIEARRRQEVEKLSAQSVNAADDVTKGVDGGKTESDEKPAVQVDGGVQDKAEPMDVDGVVSSTVPTSNDSAAAQASADVDTEEQQTKSGPNATEGTEQETIEAAGPKPQLRLPSHTRYTVSAVTSSMSAMLTGLNLPPPHGAPVGTAGPGAWVPRGAAVSIEGLVLDINSQSLNALPGISPALASVSTTDEAALLTKSSSGGAGVDWRVRVGSVMGGGGRSAGAIVEAEFLPASTLLPTSKFMHDFLHSLFPPGLVPVPPPAAPMSAPGLPNINSLRGTAAPSRTASATGTPRMGSATLGGAPITNGNAAVAGAGAVTNGSAFSYTIGGGAGTATAAPPNRNFNIPVVSDQLWEEVVPRSGEGWRKRIARRSQQMRLSARAQRRQRKNAAAATSTEQKGGTSKEPSKGTNGTGDAFGWHTFGSDDETDTHGEQQGQDSDEALSSSDSEAEPTLISGSGAVPGAAARLTGTAVTMQQVDEDDDDDDDDDDRPLGAPIWSAATTKRTSSASNATNAPATATAAEKKEDTTVQLLFQGLRPDDADAQSSVEQDGWSGIERGRRIAFQYVQMLRAEGII